MIISAPIAVILMFNITVFKRKGKGLNDTAVVLVLVIALGGVQFVSIIQLL